MQTIETRAARGASASAGPATVHAAWPTLAIAGVLAILALAPRAFGLADFLTTDEAYHWIVRTERFSAAIAEGRWADTILTGHPGVTTMWLGSVGLALERGFASDHAASLSVVEHLAWLRLPGSVLQALLIAAAYPLLRRLLDPAIALVAGLLWAASPYLIAHSRLLHLDALLTGFITLSLLLLLLSLRHAEVSNHPPRQSRGAWIALLGSGVMAGLALLTKGPALILLPFAGLTLFALAPPSGGDRPGRINAFIWRLRFSLARYGVWLGVALLTVWAVWPALWVAPDIALGRYIAEIVSNGGRPNGDGQFFNGQAVADPGAWFYLVANLFRTTPTLLIGLLAFVVLGGLEVRRLLTRRAVPLPESYRVLLALLAFVAFWTLVMTLGPKKFDRYVLPSWPALLTLAAAGLVYGARAAIAWTRQRWTFQPAGGAMLVILLAFGVLEFGQVAWYHPYYLSYYNPLLGGGAAAQRMFLIGWGEGMDRAGAWLRARPDIGYGPVISALGPTLQPFVPVDVRDVEDLGRLPINYAVVYLESIQRGANPAIYRQIEATRPLHTVTIHGIDYAQIYQLPRPYEQPVGAQFGDSLLLRGVTISHDGGRLIVLPAWDVLARPARDYLVFVHLLNQQGARVSGIDVAPGGGDEPPTGVWEPGRQIAVPLPLDLPADLPAGSYTLVMGLYAADGGRVPFSGGTPADAALAGDHALRLGTFTLP